MATYLFYDNDPKTIDIFKHTLSDVIPNSQFVCSDFNDLLNTHNISTVVATTSYALVFKHPNEIDIYNTLQTRFFQSTKKMITEQTQRTPLKKMITERPPLTKKLAKTLIHCHLPKPTLTKSRIPLRKFIISHADRFIITTRTQRQLYVPIGEYISTPITPHLTLFCLPLSNDTSNIRNTHNLRIATRTLFFHQLSGVVAIPCFTYDNYTAQEIADEMRDLLQGCRWV